MKALARLEFSERCRLTPLPVTPIWWLLPCRFGSVGGQPGPWAQHRRARLWRGAGLSTIRRQDRLFCWRVHLLLAESALRTPSWAKAAGVANFPGVGTQGLRLRERIR